MLMWGNFELTITIGDECFFIAQIPLWIGLFFVLAFI